MIFRGLRRRGLSLRRSVRPNQDEELPASRLPVGIRPGGHGDLKVIRGNMNVNYEQNHYESVDDKMARLFPYVRYRHSRHCCIAHSEICNCGFGSIEALCSEVISLREKQPDDLRDDLRAQNELLKVENARIRQRLVYISKYAAEERC